MRWAAFVVLLTACGRVGFDELCGIDAPCVSVRVDDGAAYATGPRLAVRVTATSDVAAMDTRVTAGPCNFADDGWHPYDEASSYDVLVEPTDGAKQICAWVRDANGGVGLGTGTITYETQNQPVVDAFDVVAIDATHMHVMWQVSDVEGLAAHPIDLEIKTGTKWDPLALGIGEATTGSASGSIDLAAPASPYVVRLTVTDRAGNHGIRALSDILGAPGWSVYAGSPDRTYGVSARAARFEGSQESTDNYAIDPATLDAYLADDDFGIVRIDGATGQTELIVPAGGSTNLPDDGSLGPSSTIDEDPTLHIGPDHLLYVSAGKSYDESVSGIIYQIDPRTRHCKRYIGGGTVFDQTATPSTVFAAKSTWTFGDDGALYFTTSCTPGLAPTPFRARVLEADRQPDGSAGAIHVVAGDCSTGAPPTGGPFDPLAVPLPAVRVFANIGEITVFDQGASIYLASYPGDVVKIVNGQLYTSDLPVSSTGGLAYDPSTRTLIVPHGPIDEFMPNRTGPTETLVGTRVPSTGTGACIADGVAVADACVHSAHPPIVTPDRMYFADGPVLNELRTYRLRFIDASGRLRTYIGALPFERGGKPARLIQTDIAGIAYKPASAPNQALFPAGLYFTAPLAPALARVDEASGLASIVWGNQSSTPHAYAAGDALGPDISLGTAYAGGTLFSLALDDQGLPIVRYSEQVGHATLLSTDTSGRALPWQAAQNPRWENVADGTDPVTVELWPYGALNNLTFAGTTLFLLGGYSQYSATATLRSLDFTAHTTTRLMGIGTDAYSPDTATPANASLSGSCHDADYNCFTQYRAADDRLYFSEDTRLRYITTPRTPATATLGTLFALGGPASIHNFTFRPDGSQVFYLSPDLRCHDVSSGQAYCNDTSLGPPSIVGTLLRGPDQLTWKDNNTLLISSYTGYVLQYTLP